MKKRGYPDVGDAREERLRRRLEEQKVTEAEEKARLRQEKIKITRLRKEKRREQQRQKRIETSAARDEEWNRLTKESGELALLKSKLEAEKYLKEYPDEVESESKEERKFAPRACSKDKLRMKSPERWKCNEKNGKWELTGREKRCAPVDEDLIKKGYVCDVINGTWVPARSKQGRLSLAYQEEVQSGEEEAKKTVKSERQRSKQYGEWVCLKRFPPSVMTDLDNMSLTQLQSLNALISLSVEKLIKEALPEVSPILKNIYAVLRSEEDVECLSKALKYRIDAMHKVQPVLREIMDRVSFFKRSKSCIGVQAGSLWLMYLMQSELEDNKESEIYDTPEAFVIWNPRILDVPEENRKALEAMQKAWSETTASMLIWDLNIQHERNAHANILLIDKTHKTYELFDPFGKSDSETWLPQLIKKDLQSLIPELSEYKYIAPQELCPLAYGPQAHADVTLLKHCNKAEDRGFCATYSAIYAHLRLACAIRYAYKEPPTQAAISTALSSMDSTELLTFVQQYLQWMEFILRVDPHTHEPQVDLLPKYLQKKA